MRDQDYYLQAELLDDVWTVVDDSGQRWWPSEVAEKDINASDDPAALAIKFAGEGCRFGTWYQ